MNLIRAALRLSDHTVTSFSILSFSYPRGVGGEERKKKKSDNPPTEVHHTGMENAIPKPSVTRIWEKNWLFCSLLLTRKYIFPSDRSIDVCKECWWFRVHLCVRMHWVVYFCVPTCDSHDFRQSAVSDLPFNISRDTAVGVHLTDSDSYSSLRLLHPHQPNLGTPVKQHGCHYSRL